MDRLHLSEGFPVLRECFNCGALFALNHHCLAVDAECSECNEFGHYSGFCLKWTSSRAFGRNANLNVSKSPEYTRENMCVSLDRTSNTCARDTLENKAISELLPFYGISNQQLEECLPQNKSFKDEARFYKNLADQLQLKVEILNSRLKEKDEKHCQEIRNIDNKWNKQVNAEIEKTSKCGTYLLKCKEIITRLDKSGKEEVALLKTRCKEEVEVQKGKGEHEVMLVKDQTHQLFAYTKKVQQFNEHANECIGTLVMDFKEVISRYYEVNHKPLPTWIKERSGQCHKCGYKQRHHFDYCVARGVVCRVCNKANHFSAVCNNAMQTGIPISDTNDEQLLATLEREYLDRY